MLHASLGSGRVGWRIQNLSGRMYGFRAIGLDCCHCAAPSRQLTVANIPPGASPVVGRPLFWTSPMETRTITRSSRCTSDPRLVAEIQYRKQLGEEHVTLAQMAERIRPLGYRFERRSDCRCNSQYMTGEHAGRSYPHLSLHVVEADTGHSWGNIAARRDSNWESLKALRDTMFAVVCGHVASW